MFNDVASLHDYDIAEAELLRLSSLRSRDFGVFARVLLLLVLLLRGVILSLGMRGGDDRCKLVRLFVAFPLDRSLCTISVATVEVSQRYVLRLGGCPLCRFPLRSQPLR